MSFSFYQTYISEVLVALNPNASRDEFYSFEMIEKYRQDSFNVLPSHIFKLGEYLEIF